MEYNESPMKTVITYGTFDLLHYGHIELLRRAKELAGTDGKLIVAISTDEFNTIKGKHAHLPYKKRRQLVEGIRYTDQVIPERNWGQKKRDIKAHGVDIFVMGSDWEGKFDELKELCQVVYLPRTETISSTLLRDVIGELRELEAEVE